MPAPLAPSRVLARSQPLKYTLSMTLTSEQVAVLRQVTCLITCQVGDGVGGQVDSALQELVDAMDAAAGVVMWRNGDCLALRSQAPAGFVMEDDLRRRLSSPARLGRVVRPLGRVDWLAVPMRVGGQPLGRLWIQRNAGRGFSAAERQMLALVGNQLALALENARMCQEVHDLAERRSALLRRLITLREEHGRGLARELHDEVSQSLIALLIDIDTIYAANPTAAATLQPHLERLRTGVVRVTDEIARIVQDLRPSLLEEHGLESALRRVASDRLSGRNTAIHVHLAGQPGRLDPHLETAIFRIGQEALSNVARHAQAANVWVVLKCDGGECALTVRDDGCGFDVRNTLEHPRGMQAVGLIGMQERAEQLGGQVIIESSAGAGTLITAILPLEGVCDDGKLANSTGR